MKGSAGKATGHLERDSCVLCLGPLGLASEILLLDAEFLLDSKAGKKGLHQMKGDSREGVLCLKHPHSLLAF